MFTKQVIINLNSKKCTHNKLSRQTASEMHYFLTPI